MSAVTECIGDPQVALDLQVFLEANQDVSHGLRIGVCVPSTCSSSDLTKLVNSGTATYL